MNRYDAAGEFQAYPPEISGGSILILRGETKTAAEFADFIAKRRKMTPEQIKKVSAIYLQRASLHGKSRNFYQENDKEKKDKAAAKKKEKEQKRKQKKLLKQQKAQWAKQTNQWAFDDGRFITDNACK